MKRLTFIVIALCLLLTSILLLENSDAAMVDYCQVPPYVIQDVPPNVMIVLDNSGSMFNFAYFDGFHPDDPLPDNPCNEIGSPCTRFTAPGTYPDYKYYGYFNPDYWYTYSSNRFVPAASKSAARPADSWDGNFLNWLTMRRVDVIRKVMTGGKTTSGEGSGYNRLIGEKADCDDRGKYKSINNAGNYTPYGGIRKFYVYSADAGCGGGGSGTSYFGVRNASDGSNGTGNEATFNVAVRVPIPVEGVLQNVVGTRARLGLTFYKTNEGGYVQVPVAAGNLSSAVNQINLTRPNANTPLAETLWTMAGYFAQQASAAGGPGPRYASGDFQISNNVDPYNYGTGGSPRWPSCSKSYVLFVTDGEPCSDGNLPASIKTYAAGRSDYDCSGGSCPAVSPFTDPPGSISFPSCTAGGYEAGIEDVALWAHTTDLRNNPTLGVNNMSDIQNLTLYAVFAFGKGSRLLRYAAINGGFEDINGNNRPDLQSEWDQNGDNEPDNFYEATDGNELEQAIENALSAILKRAASGTAASVLASGEGSGANLIQAVFYPRRRFGNDIVSWTGSLQNLWYYVDPSFTNSSIREDTVQEVPDRILHLINDYIAQFYFDTTLQMTRARRFQDTDGDGAADSERPTVIFENLWNIWEAAKQLWSRDIASNHRIIYTSITGTNLIPFSTANASTLRTCLQAVDDAESEYIIRYTHGEGLTTLRDEDGAVIINGIDINSDGIDDFRSRYARIGSEIYVWKLGDVLNSTPKITSWIPLNEYYKVYKDATYKAFTDSAGYKNRGMVFAGGNDGMLHAFKLGKLELTWSGQTKKLEKARLANPDPTTPLGHEMWAFIPHNALPYLKYIMDPEYCHVYTVDLTPFIFDASIGAPGSGDISVTDKVISGISAWRTILIGGMRYGGGCRNSTGSCNSTTGGLPDCVKTPIDGVGYSSYFALDITDNLADPTSPPVLLWEFSNPQLGFATTGPAVVKIEPDTTKNGKWFVVFGSGPTGPIDTTNNQFLGRSDQNLMLFVLDLKDGSLKKTIDTGISSAFAGSMINTTYDHKLQNYSDDAIYIGYVKKTGADTWTDGGVGRLVTKESSDADQWTWSKVIDNIGTVTSSVTNLYSISKRTTWLYFGTGRYYFELGPTADDPSSQRTLFGIKEPCVTLGIFDHNCTTTIGFGSLTDRTTLPAACITDPAGCPEPDHGWYINLDASGNYTYCEGGSGNCPDTCTGTCATKSYWAERMITDPVASTSTGVVFFTTYKPYNDECGLGGKSFVWATRYNSGGLPGPSLKGIALLQVSTGSIEQMNLSTAFTLASGRKTAAMEGVPPTQQGLTLISQPKAMPRVVHIRER